MTNSLMGKGGLGRSRAVCNMAVEIKKQAPTYVSMAHILN